MSEGYPECHKRRYPDEVAAKWALEKLRMHPKPGHNECRYYRCPTCRGMHLTSQP